MMSTESTVTDTTVPRSIQRGERTAFYEGIVRTSVLDKHDGCRPSNIKHKSFTRPTTTDHATDHGQPRSSLSSLSATPGPAYDI